MSIEEGFASLFQPVVLADAEACALLLQRLEHAKARARVAEVSAQGFNQAKEIKGTRWFWLLPEEILWRFVPPTDGAPGNFCRVASKQSWWDRGLDRLREFIGSRRRRHERKARHRLQRR